MKEPPIIDHNPHERREPKWLWKAMWAFVAVLWVLQILSKDPIEWDSLFLGGITFGVLALWAMEKTGGEVPESWRKPTRRR